LRHFQHLAGNCLLSFDQVFISKEGKRNPFARKRDLRSLYSPKAERVLRVLLSAPGRWWKVQPLAKEAGVSLGQGFNVKKLLVDREWVEIGDNGFRLTDPAKLLSEWEENYDYRHNAVRGFYTPRPATDQGPGRGGGGLPETTSHSTVMTGERADYTAAAVEAGRFVLIELSPQSVETPRSELRRAS
jgi:hypothetical protein